MPAYSTPRPERASPSNAGGSASSSRRFSPYPTSLRTSLFRSVQPAPPALRTPLAATSDGSEVAPGSTYTARTLPSRVPLLETASLPSKRRLSTSSASLYAPSPRVASPHSTQGRTARRSLGSATSNTAAAVNSRTNPFEALSAPAFDDFISHLTSTLRDSLDPTHSHSARKAARERRQLAKDAERRQREQDEQSERELLDRVRAITEAQTQPGGQQQEDEERGRDVFGEVKEVGSGPQVVNGLDIVAAAIQVAEEVAAVMAPETSLPPENFLESAVAAEVEDIATTAEEAAAAAQLALAQHHRADVDRLYSHSPALDPPNALPETEASPAQTEEILLLDSDDDDDAAAMTAEEAESGSAEPEDEEERDRSPGATEAAGDQSFADEAQEEEDVEEESLSPLRFDTVEQDVDVIAEDLVPLPEIAPLPSYLAGLVGSAAPLSDTLDHVVSSAAAVDNDDEDDLEMREYAPPGGRQPLFVSRATASATTSEADGDEIFHVESVERFYSDSEEEDAPSEEEVEEEIELEAAGQDGIRAEDFARLRDASATTLDDPDRPFDDPEAVEGDYITIDEDELASAPEEEEEEADVDEDPTVRKDPFGRLIRYEDYGSEIEYDENDIREDPLMRSYDDRYEETSRPDEEDASVRDTSVEDGGSAMDSAEAEWAGRRKIDRDDSRSEEDEAASERSTRVETLEFDSDSDAEVQVEGEADIDELDEDPANRLESASPILADTALMTTQRAETSYPESTATTPGLVTPMLLTPALSEYATDPGLASGVLADVDEAEPAMSIASTTGEADASVGFARDDDDDEEDGREGDNVVTIADSSVEMDRESPSMPLEHVPLPFDDPPQLAPERSEAVANVAPIEVDVSEAELADVEAEDAEPDRTALATADASAGATEAVDAAQDFPESSASTYVEAYDTVPAFTVRVDPATEQTEQSLVVEEQSLPGSPAALAANPLEALYADEDSEYSHDRIPYEKKGKGKAIDHDDHDELVDHGATGIEDDAASEGSSPSSVAEDDIEMALAQWHSVSDQLAGYSNSELVEKLIELQDQHDAALHTNSSLELLIRVQLYDFQIEYERRVQAGDLQESDEEDGEGQSAPSWSADGEIEYDYSDYPDQEDDDGRGDLAQGESYGDEYHDEEYERASSEAPPSPDRSAFPETRSPSPTADMAQAAEREAADVQIAQIAGDLVEMYESSGGSAQLHVPASTASLPTFGAGPVEHASSSLYDFGGDIMTAPQTVEAEAEELVEAEAEEPTSSSPAAPAERSSVDAMTFTPHLDPPLDPHRAFIRSAEVGHVMQHAGNIEYEVAPPIRSTSPPRFELPPTEHNVDSPITSADEQEDYRQVDNGIVRVGVEEEEMFDSSLVGRERPLQTADNVSAEVHHVQDDRETAAEPQRGLLVVDDDEEVCDSVVVEQVNEQPSSGSSLPLAHRQYGATPPPTSTKDSQEMPPILDGVAPPVNFDIVPEPVPTRSEHPPANEGLPVSGDAGLPDVALTAAESNAHPETSVAEDSTPSVELDAQIDTASHPRASTYLNRETASEVITSNSCVPYTVPPTAHREDSPLEDGEVVEDDEVVRVGVSPDEMRDATLVEEARPLGLAIDAVDVPRGEQQDTQAAPLGPSALVIIDDDDDVEQNDTNGAAQQDQVASVTAEIALHTSSNVAGASEAALANEGLDPNRVDSFPAGVAPPQNPSILPAAAANEAPLSTLADYVALDSEYEDDEDVQTEGAFDSICEPAVHDVQHAALGLDADETVQPDYEAPALSGDSDSEDQHGDADTAHIAATPTDLVHIDGEEGEITSVVPEGGDRMAEKPSERQQSADEHGSVDGGHHGVGAEPDRSVAFSTVQVIIEVDTDAEGDKPIEVESVRGSSIATEDIHRFDDNIDVMSACSTDEPAQTGVPDFGPAADVDIDGNSHHVTSAAAHEDEDSVTRTDFAQQPSSLLDTGNQPEGFENPARITPSEYSAREAETESEDETDEEEEVAAMLLGRTDVKAPSATSSSGPSPHKRPRRRRLADDDRIAADEDSTKPRRSARLSATPVPASAKRVRKDTSVGTLSAEAGASESTEDSPHAQRHRKKGSHQQASEAAPFPRPHRHRHHVPEVHGSDTDDGMTPPVTRSHCHFQRLRIRSRTEPDAPPYLFNVPACALASEVARDTLKAFEAEDLGAVDETDGCEGIQLGGVAPTDAYAIEVMASRHSSLVPHNDVLDAVRRIAGPELWDEGACEIVPLEEMQSAPARGKRKILDGAQEARASPKKRRT